MITIQVTANHIARGELNHCMKCPVALAMTEALGFQVWVSSKFVEWADHDEIQLPGFVQDQIANFDARRGMEPFSFEVQI